MMSTMPSLMAILAMTLCFFHTATAASSFNFIQPSLSTEWALGQTVRIEWNWPLTATNASKTMLYLEFTTRACTGSVPDEERYCDNRAARISALGSIPAGSSTFMWTIPTTLDLRSSRGKFHIYDYNGHSSDSFTITPTSSTTRGSRSFFYGMRGQY